MRLRQVIGHRGAFLLFLFVLDVLFGYSIYITDLHEPKLYPILPEQGWAILWMFVGIVCFFSAFLGGYRDRIAFGLSAFLKTAWALRYAWLWYLGVPFSWVAVSVWLAFAAIVLVISSWPEPVKIREIVLPKRIRREGSDGR